MENSPFGLLPAELRNRIYELVLVRDRFSIIVMRTTNGTSGAVTRDKRGPMANALLFTCKIINAESQPLFYGSNTFELFTRQDRAANALQGFLSKTTTLCNLRLLRQVRVNIRELVIAPEWHEAGTSEEITEILNVVKSHRECLPDCSITLAFKYEYHYGEKMLHLELQTASQTAMAQSVAECMKQIRVGTATIKNKQTWHVTDAYFVNVASNHLSSLELLLNEIRAAFADDVVDE